MESMSSLKHVFTKKGIPGFYIIINMCSIN